MAEPKPESRVAEARTRAAAIHTAVEDNAGRANLDENARAAGGEAPVVPLVWSAPTIPYRSSSTARQH